MNKPVPAPSLFPAPVAVGLDPDIVAACDREDWTRVDIMAMVDGHHAAVTLARLLRKAYEERAALRLALDRILLS